MADEVSHGAASRERVAPNVYKRTTRAGEVRFEVMFRDVDGRQRARRLDARSERAAIREARTVLAQRDSGERIVAAELTVDELAERDYFPMLASLAAAGRRSERGLDDERDRYRLHVKPQLGGLRLGDVDARHVSELIATMRAPTEAIRRSDDRQRRRRRARAIPRRTVARLRHPVAGRRSTGSTRPSSRSRAPAAPAACSTSSSSPRSSAARSTCRPPTAPA